MRVGVIGGGIAGLTAAYRLAPFHDVTLFEANNYLGGHTHTIDVSTPTGPLAIDTGFIVFNDRTYPNFCRLLDELGVASEPTEMSFSVQSEPNGVEYCGSNLNGLFAQRSNLFRPRFYRMLRDFFRFGREAHNLLALSPQSASARYALDRDVTVEQYLHRESYSKAFIEDYFLPMGSAIWSCPRSTFGQFPLRFILEFYHHHGLLTVGRRPQWRVICGGSRTYVQAMASRTSATLQTSIPVLGLVRSDAGVSLHLPDNRCERFDHVVMACHSDQALRILGSAATAIEREILSAFPYERNTALLHTDRSLLPRRRRAWASWNYHVPRDEPDRATVTYNMNILQRLRSNTVYCVTLNGDRKVAPSSVLGRFEYEHPIFTLERRAVQQRHRELINHQRISYCGAYWGNGFHEDGVRSAIAVSDQLTPSSRHSQHIAMVWPQQLGDRPTPRVTTRPSKKAHLG